MKALIFIIGLIGLLPSSVSAMSCPMKMTINTHDTVKEWRSVNDGVMGGRSSGGPNFYENHMVFSGVINTNGGGFSSIRRSIEPDVLSKFKSLKLRIKSDARIYKLTLRTDARYGWRQVSFQAQIPETKVGEWAEVVIPFDTLKASIFGRPINGVKFDVSKVQSIGIIIADGRDGPFLLGLNEISGCHDWG